ncbi:VOC family protein [Nonomuraea sp. 3-1Str]|uniref:VOC family protein n=1 Tax=Nonomuraea sp. 3-1Str TaxID=2929801 RepID=UPI0028641ECF|nr:VOC family protein [Nonomuraea sp. 3-1Str]MDR8408024.1 VOC family protein [Nonomuraea sp. 3-1Str]
MDIWANAITAITLFVEDLAAAKTFYMDVFRLPVHYEDPDSVVFRIGSTLVNLLSVAEAPGLVTPAGVGTSGGGARAVLTITVDDVDAVAADVVSRGAVLLNGPVNRPWGVRTASFRDPAGHVWEIAGELTAAD